MMDHADIEAIHAAVGGELDAPLGPLTTYRVGGPAALMVEVGDDLTLARLGAAIAAHPVDVMIIGRGSNLLVADAGFAGVAVRLGGTFEEFAIDPDGGRVRAGAAVSFPVLARHSVAAGLRGLEWAVGVPGSVGGAVRMNAGGHGSDVAASLVEIRRFDLRSGQDLVVAASALELGYRTSALSSHHAVVEATFALESGSVEAGERVIGEIVRWRRENQPGGQNAGSVFVNPPGDSAGRLIEVAGAKGLRIGSAEVSPRHANFIQADPGGSAADVVELMAQVRQMVIDQCGIELRPETVLVGFDDVLGGS